MSTASTTPLLPASHQVGRLSDSIWFPTRLRIRRTHSIVQHKSRAPVYQVIIAPHSICFCFLNVTSPKKVEVELTALIADLRFLAILLGIGRNLKEKLQMGQFPLFGQFFSAFRPKAVCILANNMYVFRPKCHVKVHQFWPKECPFS